MSEVPDGTLEGVGLDLAEGGDAGATAGNPQFLAAARPRR